MGLDIILGLVILTGAVRGWLRGFVIQAIRLAGLVGSVYAAAPVRDQVKPYLQGYLTSVRPDLLDRMLWWAAAVLTYVLSVGLASLAVTMYRRRPFGEVEPNRTDQFAGFLLGAIKAGVFVTFLTASLQKYAVDRVKGVDWAEEQAKGSYALMWDGQYKPAEKVWTSPPVQHFVAEVRRKGLGSSVDPAAPESRSKADPEAVRAANADGPPRLELNPPLDPGSVEFTREFDRLFNELAPGSPPGSR